jgi:hypothetical protein
LDGGSQRLFLTQLPNGYAAAPDQQKAQYTF